MSKELSVNKTDNEISTLWDDELTLKDIKDIYAPKANPSEFKAFIQLGKATGLNPYLRELWLIKYDEKASAQIFIGRDGYRKAMTRNKAYDGHYADAVYSNDEFKYDMNSKQVIHHPNLKDRGHLVGAYCITKMKNISMPFFVFVDMKEYNKKRSVWNEMPATMIKKVAEAQCLRMASPDLFGGSYDESEKDLLESSQEKKQPHGENDQLIATLIEGKSERIVPVDEILNMIEDSESEDDLENVSDFVKHITNRADLAKIRGAYKKKLNELRSVTPENVDAQTGEIQPPSEYEKIKNQLLKAKSIDVLDVAGDLIRSIDNDDERDELSRMYVERKEELKG